MSNSHHSYSIGIVGVGMVGGAVKKYFEDVRGEKPHLYDPGKNLGSVEEVNQSDIVFVCVPTPYEKDKGFDLQYVESSIEKLEDGKVVVIKSTVLPGATEKLQKKYSQHKLLFNPEFLVESKANETMQKPDRQIVGYTKASKEHAEDVLRILPEAPFKKIMPATEAETVKYFGNTFLAKKVIFANHMYDLCEKLGIDYNSVAEAASKDPRIGPSHLDVHHAGYRGYGGACLPKDTRALLQLAENIGVDMKLLKTTEELNNKLLEEQGIDDPEQYSERNPY